MGWKAVLEQSEECRVEAETKPEEALGPWTPRGRIDAEQAGKDVPEGFLYLVHVLTRLCACHWVAPTTVDAPLGLNWTWLRIFLRQALSP